MINNNHTQQIWRVKKKCEPFFKDYTEFFIVFHK